MTISAKVVADINFADHWDDVGGYAIRVSKTIRGDLAP